MWLSEYVYRDSKYDSAWISEESSKRISDYLAKRGFEQVNANGLADIMNKALTVSDKEYVIVFSQDVVPDTIVDNAANPTQNSLVAKFLNAGHSIIWSGDIPLYYIGASEKQKVQIPSASANILGIPVAQYGGSESQVTITAHGYSLGLRYNWRGKRALNPSSVPNFLTLAHSTDTNFHHSWIRFFRYNQCSGLIRLFDMEIKEISDEMLAQILLIAKRTNPSYTEFIERLEGMKNFWDDYIKSIDTSLKEILKTLKKRES